jgi:hypothetical protein
MRRALNPTLQLEVSVDAAAQVHRQNSWQQFESFALNIARMQLSLHFY